MTEKREKTKWEKNHLYSLWECEAGINIIDDTAFLNIRTPKGETMTFIIDKNSRVTKSN